MTTTETPVTPTPSVTHHGGVSATTQGTTTRGTTTSSTGTLSVLSLVGGIASIVFGQAFFVPIAAVVLGVLGYRREPQSRAFAIWGIVLGSVALLGWALVGFIGFVGFALVGPLLALGIF